MGEVNVKMATGKREVLTDNRHKAPHKRYLMLTVAVQPFPEHTWEDGTALTTVCQSLD